MKIHEFGQSLDEVVVLVHPSVVMWDYFEYVIPLMQEHYHLIVPADLFGESRRPENPAKSLLHRRLFRGRLAIHREGS